MNLKDVSRRLLRRPPRRTHPNEPIHLVTKLELGNQMEMSHYISADLTLGQNGVLSLRIVGSFTANKG